MRITLRHGRLSATFCFLVICRMHIGYPSIESSLSVDGCFAIDCRLYIKYVIAHNPTLLCGGGRFYISRMSTYGTYSMEADRR